MDKFKKQLDDYSARLRGDRCPLSQQELDKAVRHATWQPKQAATKPLRAERKRIYAPWAAAAACLLAVLIPLGLRPSEADGISEVSLDGQTALFVCNRGCSAERTIDMFNHLIR